MKSGESLGFSIWLCTFFAVQDRILTGYLREENQVTYSELTLITALYEVDDPITLESLADYAMLSPRTVRSMLLVLEDKGFIIKYDDPDDGRYMLAGLSDSGKALTKKTIADIYLLTKETFWEALPESEFGDVLKMNMRNCVNHIRGTSVESFGDYPHTDLLMTADHFIFWRVVVDRWARATREKSDLSLNDFRVLYCLYESGELSSREMTDILLLPKSVLSLCKKHLVERNLIQENSCDFDSRRVSLACTPEGEYMAKAVFELLDEITRDVHFGMSEGDSHIVNAWYARMFSNMQRLRQ